jgi:hypothetical protein
VRGTGKQVINAILREDRKDLRRAERLLPATRRYS